MDGLLSMTPAIRVVCVDDNAALRFLLRTALSFAPDFEFVGEAENGKAAIDEVRRTRPDLILLDLAMPVMSGMEALPHLLEAAPGTRVVILSMSTDAKERRSALAAGAHDFIDKSAPTTILLERLRAVAAPLRGA